MVLVYTESEEGKFKKIDLEMEASVEVEFVNGDHVGAVERVFRLHAVHVDHGGVRVQAHGMQHDVALALVNFNVHTGVFVFPCEGVFVDELPVPLVAVDGDVEAMVIVRDAAPHVRSGRRCEHGQPSHKDGGDHVEGNLQLSVSLVVAALKREGAGRDLPEAFRLVFRNPCAETSHEEEHDTEGENTDDDGPKQELVVEHRKQCVLSSHWTPSFRASGGPSLSVVRCGNASLSTWI